MTTSNGYSLTRINSDTNGNPRYVIHFLALANEYSRAVYLANQIGGRKYHTKSYGGGLVFQSYNTDNLIQQLDKLTERK